MGGREPTSRIDFIGAAAVGVVAAAVARFSPYQSVTLTEIVLFGGGAVVGAYARSSVWSLWLACAIPWVSTIVLDLLDPASRARENAGLLPIAILFLAFSWAVATLFFVAGLVAARSATEGSSAAPVVLSQVGLFSVVGTAVPLGILTIAKAFGGQRTIDGPWPLVIVVASCVALGGTVRLVGRRTESLARLISVAAGVNIGLALWMSTPEPSNLGPLFLTVLAFATVAGVGVGAKLTGTRHNGRLRWPPV
jgi:hypothetical protein